jgi:hypothetical protein
MTVTAASTGRKIDLHNDSTDTSDDSFRFGVGTP